MFLLLAYLPKHPTRMYFQGQIKVQVIFIVYLTCIQHGATYIMGVSVTKTVSTLADVLKGFTKVRD